MKSQLRFPIVDWRKILVRLITPLLNLSASQLLRLVILRTEVPLPQTYTSD